MTTLSTDKKPVHGTDFLNKREKEIVLYRTKRLFQEQLAQELNLIHTSAPLFVRPESGLQDDLNGIERPVSFHIKSDNDAKAVIVHSLAKWKRMTLGRYQFTPGEGIYTDMKAIRADEELDAIHSLYVDQWDWERVIVVQDRTIDFLKTIVRKIYKVIKQTELEVQKWYPHLIATLPSDIYFIHSQELEDQYPSLTPKQREHEICKKHGAVFIIGIGGVLESGIPHDGRAPDYDDWTTQTNDGFKGLNGDILVWNPVLKTSFELSSMGIRVDKTALVKQLDIRGCPERITLPFHHLLMHDLIPLSIGGGIGQSRLCMLLLKKKHIGQVQSSVWPERIHEECHKQGIELL